MQLFCLEKIMKNFFFQISKILFSSLFKYFIHHTIESRTYDDFIIRFEKNGNCRNSANSLPTVLFPAPMKPMNTILCDLSISTFTPIFLSVSQKSGNDLLTTSGDSICISGTLCACNSKCHCHPMVVGSAD